jgi:hypothetical protein
MVVIAAWPVVSRDRIVHGFKPGGSASAEGPFRTLRRHGWASAGVRVPRRADHGLAGQMTIFSALNVVSGRLARHGNASAAERVARAAADLEAGPEFEDLRRQLADLSDREAEQVISGEFPSGSSSALREAVRAVASRTERIRGNDLVLSSPAERAFAGWIAEMHEEYVVLRTDDASTVIPRWMAVEAHRDQAGAFLALMTDRLDGASAVVEAVPAIDVEGTPNTSDFTPYGRAGARVLSITAEDARLLAGEPEPLRIFIPVPLEE